MSNLFYFLSKTDEGVISHCPSSTRNIHATLGFFVLMTGVMAFISGSYAVSNMFIHENPLTGHPEMVPFGMAYSMLLGAVYASFIMAIDREIVSANTRWAAAFRIPLAIVISIIVSVPVELQIFEARINKHLVERHNSENDGLLNKLESRNRVKETEERIKELDSLKLQAEQKRTGWAEAIEAEVVGREKPDRTGIPGKGPAYEEAMMNKQLQEDAIDKYDVELKRLDAELKDAKGRQDQGFEREKVPQSYDLLSKYIALKEIKAEDKTGSATAMGYGVMMLFFLFELIPSITKLFLPQTEYDVTLNNRRRLNIHAAKMIFRQSYSDYEGMSVDEIETGNHIVVEKMFNAQAV